MTAITFDTLKYANRLKSAGVPDKQAEVMAEMQAEVFDKNLDDLATKRDLKELELRMAADMAKIHGELATMRWGIAIIVGGIIALILKTFFPH
ncbi:MAG: CCDC90 family protein [Magnetococcus sp. MYC-9]